MIETKIIFGIRVVMEAIQSGTTINKVYIQKGLRSNSFVKLHKLLKQNNIAISLVPVEKLNRLTKNANHQGIVGQISPVKFYDLETLLNGVIKSNKVPLFLILYQLSDVRNFGSIIRTAECTGVDAIIIQKDASAPVNGETVKTSDGAAFKVPICRVNHIKDALFMLQSFDIKIIAADEKAEDTLFEVPLNQPIAIVLGSEQKGIHSSILKMADHKVKLPLLGQIESLNVSVACGAFLYETIRQRLTNTENTSK